MRPGKTCASRASCGNCGRAKLHMMLVDWSLVPLGWPTIIGDLVVPLAWYGSFVRK